jgi:hypothetical protein
LIDINQRGNWPEVTIHSHPSGRLIPDRSEALLDGAANRRAIGGFQPVFGINNLFVLGIGCSLQRIGSREPLLTVDASGAVQAFVNSDWNTLTRPIREASDSAGSPCSLLQSGLGFVSRTGSAIRSHLF